MRVTPGDRELVHNALIAGGDAASVAGFIARTGNTRGAMPAGLFDEVARLFTAFSQLRVDWWGCR